MRAARTILAALPNIGNPFYSTILDAVIRQASSRGYSVLVASRLGDDPTRWLSDYLLSNRADGLLLFDGSLDTRALHGLVGDGSPLPLVAAYDELPDPQINSVLTDNRLAAMRAVRHLIELGHRDIAHVTGAARNASPNERLVGYRQAMTEAGLRLRPEWIIPGDYTMDAGMAAAKAVVALAEQPSAVFCGNDETSIGFISTLREAGIECPRDISVVGFDDIAVSRHFAPPLTTMRQPRDQLGAVATDALIDIIEGTGPTDAPVNVVLNAELVVRASTAPFTARDR
jgi:LacI family repressor for deo operon, udp, cdd, tsx, nupC, and nupG